MLFIIFFFNDTATTEIYTLSLHDALPIFLISRLVPELGRQLPLDAPHLARPLRDMHRQADRAAGVLQPTLNRLTNPDRKSTRLNSSHANISYAVFCLKKKHKTEYHHSDLH